MCSHSAAGCCGWVFPGLKLPGDVYEGELLNSLHLFQFLWWLSEELNLFCNVHFFE